MVQEFDLRALHSKHYFCRVATHNDVFATVRICRYNVINRFTAALWLQMMKKKLTQDISPRDVQEVFVGDVFRSLVKCYNERDVKNVSQRDGFVFAV